MLSMKNYFTIGMFYTIAFHMFHKKLDKSKNDLQKKSTKLWSCHAPPLLGLAILLASSPRVMSRAPWQCRAG